MKIAVLGAGAWGTALAISASRPSPAPHEVTLWARNAQQAADMATERRNSRYLPDVALPPALQICCDPVESLAGLLARQDLIVIGTPMSALRGMLQATSSAQAPVAWLCKGFEAPVSGSVGLLGHEIRASLGVGGEYGVLSGPSFALEVARGQPTALVAASASAAVREALVAAFHGPALRIYASEDMAGVEVGGAVKNVLAIATGLCDGLGLGLNARAALITRGLAEITRLGVALGARTETFMGLSGLGDLVLTATGDLSRNRKVGLMLAQGLSLTQAVASLGHVAEGVYCARTVLQRARALQIDMPITQSVVDLLDGRIQPAVAVAALMGRGPVAEVRDLPPPPGI
ncbi:glycerol-3-phosphate dehydrogenase [Rhodoferax koreense]|uniref:Glycerol-3-phosphate dehydrogenase [NAD(P)+] n=1 Tax=Rhodoferax koreensis TaxID=1842727 RepID=A0A1P8JU44_9BURK|nr:NAD(P)H-dependent glycerol-3-phosphate dehydrogenase [Rhodoferax koreense]APW37211.1 glycerol-3-phosphate dehydrogenase [Rhodoferax koreense]